MAMCFFSASHHGGACVSSIFRFLYRSPHGAWSVTSSAANVAKSKGTVVSAEASDEPFGLRYK